MSVIFGFTADHEERCEYPESPDELYILRPLTEDLFKSWNRMTTKKRWKSGREVEERDDDRYYALLADHLYAGWEGGIYLNAEDAKAGKTSECNLENKILFVSTQGERFVWAINTARSLGERLAEQAQKERNTFRGAPEVSARSPQAELSGLSGAV